MQRRKVLLTAAALFAIGVAFAAQPTLLSSSGIEPAAAPATLWAPGTNALVANHENATLMAAPR